MRKALAWMVAVTAAVLVGVPGVAQASNDVWTPASCAAGSFGSVMVNDTGHYLVPSEMSLCEPYQASFNYTAVVFRVDSVPWATGDKLMSYAASGARHLKVDVLPRTVDPVFAICLMRDVNTRVACVRIDTATDGTATSAPIGVDDALVAESVVFTPKPFTYLPNYCATCVTIQW